MGFFEQVADTVRYHRKQAGLTQRQLALYAGVGKTVIYDIEHQKSTVQLATLLKVLEVLNIHLVIDAPFGIKEGQDEKSKRF